MTDTSPIAAALSGRARIASGGVAAERNGAPGAVGPGAGPEPGLVESLRHHLHAGETHYPVRPGMTELRERVSGRLTELGLPDRGVEGVLITASEGEALFVALLGLGVFPGGSLTGPVGSRHQALMDWMEIPVDPDPESTDDGLSFHDPASGVTIRVVGAAPFEPGHAGPIAEEDDVVVGQLEVDQMAPFTLGFAAAEPEQIKRITKWKQASSICAPGPSQRAALWALGERP